MNPNPDSHDAPLTGDDLLMDSLLREHARAGNSADQTFLDRLDTALDAEPGQSSGSNIIATMPTNPDTSAHQRSHRVAWTLGLAACVAVAAGVIWTNRPADDNPVAARAQELRASGTQLSTALPPEQIEGTPKPIKDAQGRPLPGLELAPTKAPVLYVPKGTVLLSLDKPVTSSDENPIIGSLDLVTDGDKDAGEGYFVELWEGPQWIQIDLEQTSTVNAVWLWHFHSQKRAYHDVIVQVSDDPEFKSGVTTIFNNDYDDSSGMGKGTDSPYVETRFGKLIDGQGTEGRYLRLHSAGNSSNEMNHYIEVEIFGTGS